MARLTQYCTKASLYDGAFGGAVGWPAAGMGYVIHTEDSAIVIDGGHAEDAEPLLKLIGDTPVRLWIITHPHYDHYGALHAIASNESLRERVKVDTLCYYFPAELLTADGYHICDGAQGHMEEIADALGANTHKPSYLEKLRVGETEVCFIYVPDDCTIFKGQQNANVCSLIFTVTGKTKKALFTGDAFRRSLQLCAWRFGKELKCDILQLPHHGLCDTGLLDFYKAADARTVLIPISRAADRAMHSGEYRESDTAANLWAESNAEKVYKAFEGTACIDI